MNRWRGLVGVVSALALLLPAFAHADAPPPVFITEVQTANTSASEEFIELYNNTDVDINLADNAQAWKIQYFSSTKVAQPDFDWDTTAPSGTISLSGSIAAHNYYLLSSTVDDTPYAPGGIEPDQSYSSPHLANTGGGSQLVSVADDTITAYDHVGWFESDDTSSAPDGFYSTPPNGGSLQRTLTDGGDYADDQSNLMPFASSTTMTPKEPWTPAADQPPPDPPPSDPPPDPAPPPNPPTELEALQLTELLPNPAAPATDANDEFVEIYNPNDEAVDLNGYTIQAGMTYAYSYSFTSSMTIPSHGYLVLTSGDTNLTLANSSGQARLLDPNGQEVSMTAAYEEAPEGEAWALINEEWQWTSSPTPAAANVLTQYPGISAKASSKSKKAAKTKAAKKTRLKLPTTKITKARVLGASTDQASNDDSAPTPLNPSVLAGIGGAAVLYGAYEYRGDLANRLYQLRKYRSARRAARSQP